MPSMACATRAAVITVPPAETSMSERRHLSPAPLSQGFQHLVEAEASGLLGRRNSLNVPRS